VRRAKEGTPGTIHRCHLPVRDRGVESLQSRNACRAIRCLSLVRQHESVSLLQTSRYHTTPSSDVQFTTPLEDKTRPSLGPGETSFRVVSKHARTNGMISHIRRLRLCFIATFVGLPSDCQPAMPRLEDRGQEKASRRRLAQS
jgi:hypothetical protein